MILGRSGRLALGITAAEAGWPSENCNAAALAGTWWSWAIALMRSTATISGDAF
jgi:hypothetical protein